MILKVDDVTTEKFYELIEWLAGRENRIDISEAQKADYEKADQTELVSRTEVPSNTENDPDFTNVIRVISIKGKLTSGNATEGCDTYDLVLEIPQAMFLQLPAKNPRGRSLGDLIKLPIPDRFMREIQAILVP